MADIHETYISKQKVYKLEMYSNINFCNWYLSFGLKYSNISRHGRCILSIGVLVVFFFETLLFWNTKKL